MGKKEQRKTFFFLINCWSSVVASVVLPQFVQPPLSFFLSTITCYVQDLYSMPPRRLLYFKDIDARSTLENRFFCFVALCIIFFFGKFGCISVATLECAPQKKYFLLKRKREASWVPHTHTHSFFFFFWGGNILQELPPLF